MILHTVGSMLIEKLPDEVLFEYRLLLSEYEYDWFLNDRYTIGFASYIPSHRDSNEVAIKYDGIRFGKIMYINDFYFFVALVHHIRLDKWDFKNIKKGRWLHKDDCYIGMS